MFPWLRNRASISYDLEFKFVSIVGFIDYIVVIYICPSFLHWSVFYLKIKTVSDGFLIPYRDQHKAVYRNRTNPSTF